MDAISLSNALLTPPEDRERLALWVEGFLGFRVNASCRCAPRTPAEQSEWAKEGRQEHQSQLDYLESAFFNRHSSSVYMACRNAGKSYVAAVAILLDCWFKPGIKVAIAAFTRDQSEYIYQYLDKLLNHLEATIGRKVADRTKDELHFHNGSLVKLFSGGKSTANVTGFRPHVLFIDEADKFSQQQYDGIANCLEAGGNHPSRFDTLSTNYTLDGEGVILRQIERYENYNLTKPDHVLPARVFRTCLLDILKKCDDRFKCYDETKQCHCPLWTYCRGRAKDGDGFLRIEEAIGRIINTSRPDFEAEMMLLRPSSEFSYFPNFSIAEHVLDTDRKLDPGLLTLIAFDFGAGRCPHAALIVQKTDDGIYYVVDEVERSCALESFCEYIKGKYPSITDADCFYDPGGNRRDHIHDAKSYAQVLRQQGFFPRCKQLKRRQTFEIVHALISPADGKPRLFVNKTCKSLIRQIQSAEHEVSRGRPTAEPADGRGDDLLDCLRYIAGWTHGTYAKHSGSRHLRFF